MGYFMVETFRPAHALARMYLHSSIPLLYIAGNTLVAGSIDNEYEVLSLETSEQS